MVSGQSVTVTWGQNQAIIQISLLQVPESSTLAVFALGLMGLGLRRFEK